METNYGNYLPKKLMDISFCVCVFFLLMQYANEFSLKSNVIRIITVVLFTISMIFTIYLHLVNNKFRHDKGRLLKKLHKTMIKTLNFSGKGKALDVGCKRGELTIALAKNYKHAEITGLEHDTKIDCDINAKVEKVKKRTNFVEGNVGALGFKDQTFEAVTSCLAFSRAKVYDKGVQEALRVLKKNGTFCFVDDFDNPKHYNIQALIQSLKDAGYKQVLYRDHLENEPYVSKMVKVPGIYKNIGMLYGRK